MNIYSINYVVTTNACTSCNVKTSHLKYHEVKY